MLMSTTGQQQEVQTHCGRPNFQMSVSAWSRWERLFVQVSVRYRYRLGSENLNRKTKWSKWHLRWELKNYRFHFSDCSCWIFLFHFRGSDCHPKSCFVCLWLFYHLCLEVIYANICVWKKNRACSLLSKLKQAFCHGCFACLHKWFWPCVCMHVCVARLCVDLFIFVCMWLRKWEEVHTQKVEMFSEKKSLVRTMTATFLYLLQSKYLLLIERPSLWLFFM